jgi:citrate lyase subunit beta/citryl-CoA lyase
LSFTHYPPARARLQRSLFAVPGTAPQLFEVALNSAADYVLLDCADAVAPGDKLVARANIITALKDCDWRGHGKSISVRINGLDTRYMYRDVIELVEQAGAHIDTLLIPRVGVAADIYILDCLLTQLEMACELPERIGIEALIETTLGMAHVEDIARASPRLEALHFGIADYAASCRARIVSIGGMNPDYPGDQWHASLQRVLVACRAHGLRAIDGPFDDLHDADGYIAAARRSAALGFEGKWAIHPAQVELANDVMTPPHEDIECARRILAAIEEAVSAGRGVAQLDGRMIDAASAHMAENLVRQADAIAAQRR